MAKKTEIKTKYQYNRAKFLGKSGKHAHNWKRMYIKQHRGKNKLVSDETGGFLQCSICGECCFLPIEELKKYRSLIAKGVPTAKIIVKPLKSQLHGKGNSIGEGSGRE